MIRKLYHGQSSYTVGPADLKFKRQEIGKFNEHIGEW